MLAKKKKTPGETVIVTDAAGERVTDGRLIAVLTAAVAAYTAGGGFADNLTVRKIDRTAGPRTAWNLAGLREVIASRNL